jgi:hypothetical protein
MGQIEFNVGSKISAEAMLAGAWPAVDLFEGRLQSERG